MVRGPSVFGGYLPVQGHAAKDPFVTFEGERWYATGDIVYMDAEGHLFFAGRLGRFIKIGGEMISLPQMEKVLSDYQSRRDGLGVSSTCSESTEEVAAGASLALVPRERGDGKSPEIVLFASVPFSREEANQALREGGLANIASVREVIILDALPILGTGKTDYRELSARLK